jgi:DmsE family decaheme c-type cytochrome
MKGGCESCHGPGQAHVDAGGGRGEGGPGWISFRADAGEDVDAQNAACLGCHAGGKHLYWEGSAHDSRGLACTSCHNVMRNVSDDDLLTRSNEVDTCAQCHLIRRSQTYRNAHMPLRQGAMEEGWMTCSSCHQPHGTVTPALIDAHSLNDNCYSCHADKRGPFLFEHAPVTESCANCHEPHGSVTIYMLRMPVERLCQNCHVATRHPSQPHAATAQQDFGRGCLHCHTSIHGSNHPSGAVFTR